MLHQAAAMDDAAPQWEVSKENFQPLKAGRSARGLATPKKAVPRAALTEAEERRKWVFPTPLWHDVLRRCLREDDPIKRDSISVVPLPQAIAAGACGLLWRRSAGVVDQVCCIRARMRHA